MILKLPGHTGLHRAVFYGAILYWAILYKKKLTKIQWRTCAKQQKEIVSKKIQFFEKKSCNARKFNVY